MPVSSAKYPEVGFLVRKGGKLVPQYGIVVELNEEEAKELVGYQEEPEGKNWGGEYLFKINGKKVRFTHNKKNRPFRAGVAERYASEHLRGKWEVNGETLIFNTNGDAHSAQHRIGGYLMACAESKKPLVFKCIIVVGVSPADKVADTNDLGQSRKLSDVIFRNREFGKVSEKEQKQYATVFAHALRLVWLRCGGKLVSNAPHFPHSEALDFAKKHPEIAKAVETIVGLDSTKDEKKRISSYLTLAYAAGLMYLMATSKSKNGEISLTQWSKAEKFWKEFASGVSKGAGDILHSLRTRLSNLSQSGSEGRDEVCGTVIKAYQQWVEAPEAEVTTKQLTLKRKKNDAGRNVLSEEPRLGGLDVSCVVVEEPAAEEEPVKPAKASKEDKAEETAEASSAASTAGAEG